MEIGSNYVETIFLENMACRIAGLAPTIQFTDFFENPIGLGSESFL